jgi:hypothetical protein
MMNLVLLAATLSFGVPPAQPARAALDSQLPVVAVCSEEAATLAPDVSPCEQEALASPASAAPEAVSGNALRDLEPLGFRYCCTPPQVQACAATGGTTTCRTGVCQCQF